MNIRSRYIVTVDRFRTYNIEIDVGEICSDSIGVLTTRETSLFTLVEGLWFLTTL